MLERIQEVWPLMRDSFPGLLLKGLEVTLPLAVIAFSIGLVIAILTALVQFAKIKVLSQLARVYIWIIRGTPLLVQLYVLFYMFPKFFDVVLDPFPTAIIALSLNEGAYCAETMRAALESVPYGQFEAGYCAGMSYMQIIFRIVLPQALRTAFPPLSNSLISMVKDTSLVANITVMEMLYDARRIMSRKHETLALYIVVAVIYLLFCSVLTLLQRYGEKLLARKGMKKA